MLFPHLYPYQATAYLTSAHPNETLRTTHSPFQGWFVQAAHACLYTEVHDHPLACVVIGSSRWPRTGLGKRDDVIHLAVACLEVGALANVRGLACGALSKMLLANPTLPISGASNCVWSRLPPPR